MAAFSADWLALREPVDHAARSARLASAVASELRDSDPLRVLDLGTGHGSNLRYLVGHLGLSQDWLLVDRDLSLLSDLRSRIYEWGAARGYEVGEEGAALYVRRDERRCRMQSRVADLASGDALSIIEGQHLVTASALLDLVSERWLRELVARCRDTSAAVLFPLIYDGTMRVEPHESDDEPMLRLFNEHQQTDKGFRAALGPEAAHAVMQALRAAGYHALCDRSDWDLAPAASEMQRHLIEGWADAAAVVRPERAEPIAEWRARRLRYVEDGRSRLIVGHLDVAGWPR